MSHFDDDEDGFMDDDDMDEGPIYWCIMQWIKRKKPKSAKLTSGWMSVWLTCRYADGNQVLRWYAESIEDTWAKDNNTSNTDLMLGCGLSDQSGTIVDAMCRHYETL